MPATSKISAATMTLTDYAYREGVDYKDGHYEYTGSDEKTDTVEVWEKLKTIVAHYNVKHPDDPIYLVQSGDAVNSIDSESGGGIAYNEPFAAVHLPSYPRNEQSPLTLTLWVVLGTGFIGLGAIGVAYWASKGKKCRV